jgi:predicted ester cyclase
VLDRDPDDPSHMTTEHWLCDFWKTFDMDPPRTGATHDPAFVHRRFVDEVVIGKNIGLLDDLFATDAKLDQGSLEALRHQMEAQAVAFDGQVAYIDEIVQGDWVVHRMDITMTMRGPFMGMLATNATAKFIEVEAARVIDDRIVEMWSVVDRSDVFRQLGLNDPSST